MIAVCFLRFHSVLSLCSLAAAHSLVMAGGKRKGKADSPMAKRNKDCAADDSFNESIGDCGETVKTLDMLQDQIDKIVNGRGGASKNIKSILLSCSELLKEQQQQLDEYKGLVRKSVESTQAVKDRVGTLEAQVAELKGGLDAKEDKWETVGGQSPKVRDRASSLAPEAGFEEGCRLRSLVLKGLHLPPKHHYNSQEWAKAVRNQVEELLAYQKVPFLPIDVFPMGDHLIKVRMGTMEAQKLVLSRAHWLKGSDRWQRVYIRPSLSEAERSVRAGNYSILLQEKQARESAGESLIIRPRHNSWVEFELIERRVQRYSRNTTRHTQNYTQSNY